MGYFVVTFYRICINGFGEMLGQFVLENSCRFLDDCETPLDKTKNDPNRLLKILNSINPSVSFSMETSNNKLPFLGILIKRNDDKIWMDIYFKPRDTCWCLPFLSSHPNHCKKNNIYSSTENLHYSGKSTAKIKTQSYQPDLVIYLAIPSSN